MINIALAYMVVSIVITASGQAASSDTPPASHKKIHVKDYQSFLEYAEVVEQAAIEKNNPALRRPNETIKYGGVELSDKNPSQSLKDDAQFAYLSPDNKGMAVIDNQAHNISIIDNNGKLIRKGKIAQRNPDYILFSDTRLFAIGGILSSNGGFKIYDYEAKLIKHVKTDFVDGCIVSNSQKFFAITASAPRTPNLFILYDTEGNELWRSEIAIADHAKIIFSRDDKYAVVKLPNYWEVDKKSKLVKRINKKNKLYVLDIETHKVISEENYID